MQNRLFTSAAVIIGLVPTVDANLLYRLLNNNEFDFFDAVVDDPMTRILSGQEYTVGEMIADHPELNPLSYLPDWALIALVVGALITICGITVCMNSDTNDYANSPRPRR